MLYVAVTSSFFLFRLFADAHFIRYATTADFPRFFRVRKFRFPEHIARSQNLCISPSR